MSNRAAGKRYENKIEAYLKSLGWQVDKARAALRAIGPGKFVSSQCDLLGFADLFAVHPAKPYTLLVQAHKGTNIATRMRKGEAVPWNLGAQRVQIWTPAGSVRSGVRVHWFRDTGSVTGPAWVEYFFRLKTGVEPLGGIL